MTYPARTSLSLLPLGLIALGACASGADDFSQQELAVVRSADCAMPRGEQAHADYCRAMTDAEACAASAECYYQHSIALYGGSFCAPRDAADYREGGGCDPTTAFDGSCMADEGTREDGAMGDDPVVDPTEPAPADGDDEPSLDPECIIERGSAAHEDYCGSYDLAACDADPACYYQHSIPQYGGSSCRPIDGGPDEVYDQSCAGAPTAFHPDTFGELVITELMRNPQALPDADGEYIEIFNPTSVSWNLAGCELHDEGSNHHVFGDFDIGAEDSALLARSATPGFTPDYVYGGMFLNNSGADEVIITCDGVEIAAVRYDDSWGFVPGHSLELGLYLHDVWDDSGSWCSPTETYGAGDHGSPGFVSLCAEAL